MQFVLFFFWLIKGPECKTAYVDPVLTVQTGGSVVIPCFYDKRYAEYKKYWCFYKTDSYRSCSILAYTNETKGKASVIDYPDQSFFTVTMRNLQHEDTGYYWCAVEIGGIFTSDETKKLQLRVQTAPDVSVMSSSVSKHEGNNVTFQCLYSSGYRNSQKKWCRYKDQKCFYPEEKTDTSQSSSVQISDDGERCFTVLMTGLRLSDSGWYYCSAGYRIIPVQLTVTAIVITEKSEQHNGFTTTAPVSTDSSTVGTDSSTEITNSSTESNRDEELSPVWFLALAPALLIPLILVGAFIWIWKRRPKQDEHQLKERNNSRTTDEISSKPDDLAVYCSINDETPFNMIYSTIDYIPKPPAGEDVYSTVGPH
ncbi:polymeric immunoglobulin receptor-like 2.4 isoform X3 [Danio rerio]|uniref:polymeric immunoglobulin receptor-like 2.4 isoform X3 n=1 Tax=Danio rerio TaxID=7955 RepID=UPI003CE4B9E6